MAETPPRVSRDDLEAKFRQVKGEVDQRRATASEGARPYAVAGAVLLLIVVYLLGKRVGTRRSTVVEIRRI